MANLAKSATLISFAASRSRHRVSQGIIARLASAPLSAYDELAAIYAVAPTSNLEVVA